MSQPTPNIFTPILRQFYGHILGFYVHIFHDDEIHRTEEF